MFTIFMEDNPYLIKVHKKTEEVFNAKYMTQVHCSIETHSRRGINRVKIEYPYHILSRIKTKLEEKSNNGI